MIKIISELNKGMISCKTANNIRATIIKKEKKQHANLSK